MTPNIFSNTLTKFREGAGLTQKQLAKRANVSPSSVNRWEHGASVPKLDNAEMLETALQTGGNLLSAWRAHHNGTGLPEWARDLAASETAARSVFLLTAAGVPGMLQCESYAHTVFRAGRPLSGPKDLAHLVALRCGRLAELPELEVTAVFPATAVGGLPPAIRRDQAVHLLKWSETGRVTLLLAPPGAAMTVPAAPLMIYRLQSGERVLATDHADGTVVLTADAAERVDALATASLASAMPAASSLEYLENLT